MRRWGQIPEAKSADWYGKKIKEIYRPDIWKIAADLLLEEGYLTSEEVPTTDGYKELTTEFIDGNAFNAKDPIGYINSFEIGNKD
jgi:nitrate/nitrite transport system substrate-binding protein